MARTMGQDSDGMATFMVRADVATIEQLDATVGSLADTMVDEVDDADERRVRAGVAAMVYPTMPFNAPRAADAWPDIRTALGYGNWLGLPEVSVPAGMGADGMPALNLSIVGLPSIASTCLWTSRPIAAAGRKATTTLRAKRQDSASRRTRPASTARKVRQ